MATGAPWKLPPETMSPVSAKTIGLSVAALASISTARSREAERFARRAVHLRRTAQRVGVLHLAAVGVRRVDGAVRPAAGRGWRRTRPGPACGRAAWIRASKGTVDPRSASIDIAAAMSAARASRHASTRASARTAVDACVPLMSASPSFGPSATGLSPARCSASAPVSAAAGGRQHLAFADQHEREVRERREVAAGADRARGAARRGCTRALSSASSASTRRQPDAREALREHVGAQQHHRAHRIRRAGARRRRPRDCAAG